MLRLRIVPNQGAQMDNGSAAGDDFDKKIQSLFKELGEAESSKVWKKTLRQSANQIKNEIKKAYRQDLHKGKYRTKNTGRTVKHVSVADVSKKRYPLRRFDLQFLAGVIDDGEDSSYLGFGRSFTSYWYEKGTRAHSNYKGDYLKDRKGPIGNKIIQGIPAHETQSSILEAKADNFINEYQQKFINNLEKAIQKNGNKR